MNVQSQGLYISNTSTSMAPGILDRQPWSIKLPAAFFFGTILGLSSAGFDIWWLAWIGLAPLLVLARTSQGKLEAALVGLVFGMGYYMVAMSWYLGLVPMQWLGLADWLAIQAAVIVWVLESFHQAILFAGFALMVHWVPLRPGFVPHPLRRPFFSYLFSVPLLWIFFQWVIAPQEFFIGIPICQLAYSQYKQLPVIQIASIGGSGLLDFIIVMANAAVANLIIENTKLATRLGERADGIRTRVGSWVDASIISLAIGLLAFWGQAQVEEASRFTQLDRATELNPQAPPVPVTVVQGNVTIEEDRLHTTTPSEIAARYANLSNGHGSAILFLPEGVINTAQMAPGMLLGRLKEICNKEKKETVVGSIEVLGKEKLNAGRIIGLHPVQDNMYIKHRLVPFGEFAPLGAFGERIPENVMERIPGTRESFLKAQKTQLLGSIWGKIGMSICVEVIYPRLIADEVRRGATLLVNVSNLGWFHGSSLNRQIVAAAAMRAVENGRYLVLATNTGTSAVIDPSGMVTSMSLPGRRGVLVDTVQFSWKKTPYTRMWWL